MTPSVIVLIIDENGILAFELNVKRQFPLTLTAQ
jgi:hypothetical protein